MKIIEPDYIVVGSRALFEFSVPFRKHKDTDVLVCDGHSRYACKSIMRYDIIEIPKYLFDLIPVMKIGGIKYAIPDAVYTLKCSHLGWDILFNKHKRDVLYLKSIGCKLIIDLYYKLTDYWKESNGNKEFLDFYKTKKDFFNDYVNYIYDHDYLHEVISYPDKPLYLDCRYDGQEVAIDPKKFYALSKEKQIQFFREEITVIAAERWLIPKLSKEYNITQAYELAFHKMLISLTKDWQTDMIIFNIEDLVKPDYALFNKLKDKGIIKMGSELSGKKTEALYKQIAVAIVREINAGNLDDIGDYTKNNFLCAVENMEDEDCEDINANFVVFEIPDMESENLVFKTIEQKGGGEGEGEYAHTVIFFHDKLNNQEGKYYKFEYQYYSYDGFDFDCVTVTEVMPVIETVTVYK